MTTKRTAMRRCTYVVALDRRRRAGDDLRALSDYLVALRMEGCDVVVLDPSGPETFETNARTLRWVARHVAVQPGHDAIRCVSELDTCEHVIVADERVRYDAIALDRICLLLELHEVVDPQDYVSPDCWWGGVDAASVLVSRARGVHSGRGSSFAFRRSAIRPRRRSRFAGEHPVTLLARSGAEVFAPDGLFVRRESGGLGDWLRARPVEALAELASPLRSAVFFSLLPSIALIALVFGARVSAEFAVALAAAATLSALRGRRGARCFPLRACLFAPLWMLERAVSIYGALALRLRVVAAESTGVVPSQAAKDRLASGE